MELRETFYYHTDHLGSIRVVTDEAGNIVAGYDYDIFGYPEQSTNDESLAYTTKGQDVTVYTTSMLGTMIRLWGGLLVRIQRRMGRIGIHIVLIIL